MSGWTSEKIKKLIDFRKQGLTWKSMTKYFSGDSANKLRKAFYRYYRDKATPSIKISKTPKILVLDIETAPLEVYSWGLHEQNIGLEMIIKDWSILSYSAKWLGSPESEVMYYDNRNEKDPRNDKKLLQNIHSLLDEAECILVQNGARFDVPKLNARFVLSEMKPPSSYKIIDTYKIAKKRFGFTSNKLAYMTDNLCTKYKKQDHSEFSGIKLWKECLAKNSKAWESMEKYNKYDVLSLEELYSKVAPWDDTINYDVYSDSLENRCSCGSNKLIKNGYVYTRSGKFDRLTCKVCGKEHSGKVNLLSKEKKKSLLK